MKTPSRFHLSGVLATLIVFAATGSLSHAQILVGYNFAGNVGNETSQAPNTLDGSAFNSSTVTATNLVRGSGFSLPADPDVTQNGFGVEANTYQSTISTALTANQFIQFTLSGTGGNSISLSALSFGLNSQNGSPVPTLGLAYSTDGVNFLTTGIDGGNSGIPSADYSGGTGSSSSPFLVTVNLSAIAALQNVSGTVTIDLFALGEQGYTNSSFTSQETGTGTASTLDDITVNGTVASSVPEPSTCAMLLGGVALVAFVVRRRAQQV